MWHALTLTDTQTCLDARLFTKMQANGEIEMKLIYTAIFLFTLGACGATIDKHDEHLNAAVAVQYQSKAEASQQYVDAAYVAMWERNATGDYGEVYE